jgi:integrase
MFGSGPVTKLTPLQIQTALNAMRKQGGKKTAACPQGRPLSAKTVREIAAVINATFKAAVFWGVIDFNPMQRVKVKRAEKRESAVLEKPQLERLLSACADHEWLYLLLLLDAATGARRGELLALIWQDIDFDTGILTISKSLAQTKAHGVFVKAPKGRKARHFSIPPSTLASLWSHRAKQADIRAMFGADSDLDLVLALPNGDYLKPNSVTAKVSLLARRAGFPKGISLHTLRHTQR